MQDDFDGADEPIWVARDWCEHRGGSGRRSEPVQALTLVGLYDALAEAGAGMVLFHTLVSARGDPTNPETGSGSSAPSFDGGLPTACSRKRWAGLRAASRQRCRRGAG